MIIIACPVYKRDWILPAWFYFLENQSYDLSNIGFLFELGEDDEATLKTLSAWKNMHPEVQIFDMEVRNDLAHFTHQEGTRQWTPAKYENMVSMRNSLLEKVRDIKPEAYLSLDSDILLTNTNTIELLLSHINNGIDAVNPLMYMTPFDEQFPSVMSWVPGSDYEKAKREHPYPIGKLFKSDVIMAAKMMSKKVYMNSYYDFHPQGEDLGWSRSCARQGFELYCASYIYAPHIMGQTHMADFLKIGDKRQMKIYEAS
jgi:hypothetical protein